MNNTMHLNILIVAILTLTQTQTLFAQDAASVAKPISTPISAPISTISAPTPKPTLIPTQLSITIPSSIPTLAESSSSPDSFKFKTVYKKINISDSSLNNNIDGEMFGLQNKEVILSFDDGPKFSTTSVVLEALNKVNAKAMFFILGQNITDQTKPLILKMAETGHAVGSHTYDHSCIASTWNCEKQNVSDGVYWVPMALSFDDATEKITSAHKKLNQVLGGYVSPYFRFPYGEYDKDLTDYLTQKKTVAFQWHFDSTDSVNSNIDPDVMIDNLIKELDVRQKGIILFHDVQPVTAKAITRFLKILHDKGYQPVVPVPGDVPTNDIHPTNPTLIKNAGLTL